MEAEVTLKELADGLRVTLQIFDLVSDFHDRFVVAAYLYFLREQLSVEVLDLCLELKFKKGQRVKGAQIDTLCDFSVAFQS